MHNPAQRRAARILLVNSGGRDFVIRKKRTFDGTETPRFR
jgi:hypothetical protein